MQIEGYETRGKHLFSDDICEMYMSRKKNLQSYLAKGSLLLRAWFHSYMLVASQPDKQSQNNKLSLHTYPKITLEGIKAGDIIKHRYPKEHDFQLSWNFAEVSAFHTYNLFNLGL